jgi:PhnB protein
MPHSPDPTVFISLTTRHAASALDFYARAFGAQEKFRMPTPDGGVAHAEFMIGNTLLCISDEASDWHAYALPEGKMASCLFAINTDDCDKAFSRAVAAGAKPLFQPQDFLGKRIGVLCDPFGYRWSIRQHVEDVSPEEMGRRLRAMFANDLAPFSK